MGIYEIRLAANAGYGKAGAFTPKSRKILKPAK